MLHWHCKVTIILKKRKKMVKRQLLWDRGSILYHRNLTPGQYGLMVMSLSSRDMN